MNFPSTTDPALIEQARAGQADAQDALYREFARPVFALAYRLLARRDLAEEVMQDVFVDVLRKLDGYRGDAPFGAWLRRMTVNRCLSLLRSPWQRLRHGLDTGPEPPDEAQDAGDRAADQARLERALAQLKPEARAVLWLHDVEGYTHREIASAMGQTTSYSKSQLARAHDRLRQLLDAQTTVEAGSCMPAQNLC